MNRAQDSVAVPHGRDDDADAHEIVDFVELATAQNHLLVNRVELFWSALNLAANTTHAQIVTHRGNDVRHKLFPLGSSLLHQVRNFGVNLGVEHSERQIFEFPLHRRNSEAMGQRGKNIECLPRLPRGTLRCNKTPRPRVVKSVSELDDENTYVARHRDDHLANRLCLSGFPIRHAVELGHAIDKHGYFGAKVELRLGERVVGIFHGVVQNGGNQCLSANAQLRQNLRHRHGMGDVRLATLPGLALVCPARDLVGTFQAGNVRFGMLGANGANQQLKAIRACCPPKDSGHKAAQGISGCRNFRHCASRYLYYRG